ncbi:MAG: four-carbon acid sugar kinase family protein [Pseudomonadota bacterium]
MADLPMAANQKVPELRFAFYGDDFTGSTDALEVLAFAGLRCALFLSPPTREMLHSMGGYDAIGVAGDSRGMTPAEMDEALPPIFRALAGLDASIVHYKVCSTFDSSAGVGSIGRAIDIARDTFGTAVIPVVAGTPALARYCAFGNLFARSGTDGLTYRIDRHPIMSVHPVTPMDEADLAVHLGRQTALKIGKFTLSNFCLDQAALQAQLVSHSRTGDAAVVIDSTERNHLTQVGGMLLAHAAPLRPAFVVGSSGVEYALTQWWAEHEELPTLSNDFRSFEAVDKVLAISGSASALSARQIDTAIEAGFADIAVDASALVDHARWQDASAALVEKVVALLTQGQSVMLHTARGPDDPRIAALIGSLVARGEAREEARHGGGRLLGVRLGHIVQKILLAVPLRRLLLSGGDTSSQITRILAPDALEIEARLAPGAPLCRAISNQPHLRALQIALKGGQMGDDSYFVKARRGTPEQH